MVIIDNGSTDNVLKEYLESQDDRHIRIFVLTQNIGPAEARNYGIKNSSGRYIAFMDSDDIAQPDRIRKEFEYLESNQTTSLVCTRTKVLSEEDFNPFVTFKSDRELELFLLFRGNPIPEFST